MSFYEESSTDAAIRVNTKEAADLLVALVKSAPSYLMVPRPILAWYRRHLSVKLILVDDPRGGQLALPRDALRTVVQDEIAAVDAALGAHRD